MALLRWSKSCLTALYRNTSIGVSRSPSVFVSRPFSKSKVRLEKEKSGAMDEVPVDALSRLALVVDGRYKSMKDVPRLVAYGAVARARDKFRVKVAIASSIALTILVIFVIRKQRRNRKLEEYESMMEIETRREANRIVHK